MGWDMCGGRGSDLGREGVIDGVLAIAVLRVAWWWAWLCD